MGDAHEHEAAVGPQALDRVRDRRVRVAGGEDDVGPACVRQPSAVAHHLVGAQLPEQRRLVLRMRHRDDVETGGLGVLDAFAQNVGLPRRHHSQRPHED